MNQNILFHLVLIIALPAFNLSSDELKQSESTLDESNKQTKNEANNGSIAPPAEVRDTEGGEDDQTDGLQGSLTQEQMYRRLFESNRAIQLEAVKSIQEFGDYAQRYKLLTVMLDQLFKVLQEARTNLTQWGYMPGDPFPNNSTIMEGEKAADRAAKAALHSGSEVEIPYTVSEIGGLVRSYIKSKWQIRWDQSTHGRYFYGIKKRVSSDMTCFGKTRRDQVIISRLRLGQCNLRARLHMIASHPTGLCDGGVPETVEHYLFGCFRHIAQRTVLFQALDAVGVRHTPLALDDPRAVPAFLDFVRTTGKYMYL
ncbi:hypothetical protein ScPMuIL_010316 [Solemya velum]